MCPYSLNKAFPVALQNIFHVTKEIPEITAIFMDPCSSRAILSASSINSIPKPWESQKTLFSHKPQPLSITHTRTYLMLEFRWIASTDRNHTAVTMATRSRNGLISYCTIALSDWSEKNQQSYSSKFLDQWERRLLCLSDSADCWLGKNEWKPNITTFKKWHLWQHSSPI